MKNSSTLPKTLISVLKEQFAKSLSEELGTRQVKSQECVFMTKASCVHNTMTSSIEIALTRSLSADQSNNRAIQDALQAAQFYFKFVFVISIYLKISL
jgi:hypothetical protein